MIIHGLLFVLMSVCLYAEAMAISVPRVAATQFSIYMAVLNLGTSYGAQQFKLIKPEYGFAGGLAVAAGVSIAAALLFAVAAFVRLRADRKVA
jgi:PAT family beta-lactamase induction signal transducer AmpG